MLRNATALFLILLGLASAIYGVATLVFAWGQWRCGINGIVLISTNLAAALFLSCAALVSPQPVLSESMSRIASILAPWIAALTLVFVLLIIAPECPFPSR